MKKFVAILLAVAMLACLLCGCAGNNDSKPDESVASGDAAIKIGGIGPLTGGAAVYGTATKQGAEIAVEEINALGGLQFELNSQDDENDAEKAVNAYNSLKDWGAQVIYGCTTTAPCVAVSAETNTDRYFELTPSASSTDVTSGKDNVFQMCFTDPNQGYTAAEVLKEKGLGTKIAAIYNNGDAYSTGIYQAFAEKCEELGLEVVSVGTFPSDDTTDFTVQLTEAQQAGADLVFLPIYYTPASLILSQAKTMGYAPTFFGCDGLDGILAMEGFDTTLAENVILITPFNPWSTEKNVADFVAKYQEKYNETPNQFAADGYDCMYAIYEACKEAGITAETPHEEVCKTLSELFAGGTFTIDGLTGSSMTWDTEGAITKAPVVVKIENGIYVNI